MCPAQVNGVDYSGLINNGVDYIAQSTSYQKCVTSILVLHLTPLSASQGRNCAMCSVAYVYNRAVLKAACPPALRPTARL